MLLFIEVILVVLVGALFYLFRALFWMTMSMHHIYSWSDIAERGFVYSPRFKRAKRILHKVEDAAGISGVVLRLSYIKNINAMVTYGCNNGKLFPVIRITWGALKIQEEFIAAILAHELGHVKLHPYKTTLANQQRLSMAELRERELVADWEGVEILAKAGFDPFASWRFHNTYDSRIAEGIPANLQEYSDDTWDHSEPTYRRAFLRNLACMYAG